MALSAAGLTMKDIGFCVGTGYGRERIPFVGKTFSEIACHAKGAHWLLQSVRTIIDVGGQDCKAIRLDEKGNIVRFITNDKCASGTGRFLEIMAEALEVALEELGELALVSQEPVSISNQCTVFAETEVVSLLNNGKAIPDIASGLIRAMAHRIAALAKGIGLEPDITMSGGVAKNRGMFVALEEVLGVDIKRLDGDPQLNGALGAALLAKQAMRNHGSLKQ